MTRFDAADPAERRRLYAEAVRAHREGPGPHLTVEVDAGDGRRDADPPPAGEGGDPVPGAEDADLGADGSVPGLPWIQFRDGVVNLDCTDEELERLKRLVDEYPALRVEDLHRPEGTPGTNARVLARADPDRVADFLEAAFRRVYGLPADYRAWVVEV